MPTTFSDPIQARKEGKWHQKTFTMWPELWKTYTHNHNWHLLRLRDSDKESVPNQPGVYTLLTVPDVAAHPACSYVMYVGQAVSLRRRFSEYLSKEADPLGRPKISDFLHMYSGYIWFSYTLIQKDSLDSVEAGIRDALVPPLNTQLGAHISKIVGAFS